MVHPDALHHLVDIDPEAFADVSHLVCKRDLRREEGVRGVLDHLRGGEPAPYHRGRNPLVGGGDGVPGAAVPAPDHDPVRVQEVLDRKTLAEKLRVHRKPDLVAGTTRPAVVPGGTVLFTTTVCEPFPLQRASPIDRLAATTIERSALPAGCRRRQTRDPRRRPDHNPSPRRAACRHAAQGAHRAPARGSERVWR